MDPNSNLKSQLEIAARLLGDDGLSAADIVALSTRLAELVEALNGWIKGGGFLPAAWKR